MKWTRPLIIATFVTKATSAMAVPVPMLFGGQSVVLNAHDCHDDCRRTSSKDGGIGQCHKSLKTGGNKCVDFECTDAQCRH